MKSFLFLFSLLVSATATEKIRLQEIKVLALSKNKMTTGRRSGAVPQLTCRGHCSEFTPASVLCTNMGFDGRDVQWKCESDMPDGYRFGTIDVSCEGYAYPDDPYILIGSCGLTYELERGKQNTYNSPHNEQQRIYRSPYNDYDTPSSSSYGSSTRSGLSTLVGWAVAAVVVYAVYRIWKSGRIGGGGRGGGGGFRPDPRNPPGGAPPPYYGDSTTGQPPGFGTSGPSQRPGFMSGAMAGGALGYLLGRNNQHSTNTNAGFRPAGASHSSGGQPRARDDSNGGGGGVRTGYGGTSRR